MASERERSSNESDRPIPVRLSSSATAAERVGSSPAATLGTGLLLISVVVAAIGFATAVAGRRAAPGAAPPGLATVEQVIDGDTIEVRLGRNRQRVRLLGVDTPESVNPSTPVQCFGVEASDALSRLLPPGTAVELARDVESHDHYGRLLAYVHRADDALFINQWLLDEGYADAISYEPNTTYRAEFSAAARAAERDGRGLWGQCDGPDQALDPTG